MPERPLINHQEAFAHQTIQRVLKAAIEEGIISPEESSLIYQSGDGLGKVLGGLVGRIEARGEDHNIFFAKCGIGEAVLQELS